MANNYLQFSTEINQLTDEEVQWWKDRFSRAHKIISSGADEMPDITADDIEREETTFNCIEVSERGYKNAWIHADESANPEHIADVIQEFLKAHRPKSCVGFSWAETCDKMRLDEFGGGAVFITAEKQEWMSLWQWLQEQKKSFEKSS